MRPGDALPVCVGVHTWLACWPKQEGLAKAAVSVEMGKQAMARCAELESALRQTKAKAKELIADLESKR
eukprot:365139-Chlamydomonas_euryale.AAC.4